MRRGLAMPSRVLWLRLRFHLLLRGRHVFHSRRHLVCHCRAHARNQKPHRCHDYYRLAHCAFPSLTTTVWSVCTFDDIRRLRRAGNPDQGLWQRAATIRANFISFKKVKSWRSANTVTQGRTQSEAAGARPCARRLRQSSSAVSAYENNSRSELSIMPFSQRTPRLIAFCQ